MFDTENAGKIVCYGMHPETSGNPLPGDHPKYEATLRVREPRIKAPETDLEKSHTSAHEEDDEVHDTRIKDTGADLLYTACPGKEDNPREYGVGLRGLRLETHHDCGEKHGRGKFDRKAGRERDCHTEPRNSAPI